jgi:heptosyltransferase I
MFSKELPDLSSVKKVLIIRLSSIGDVTHALPLAAALKAAWPHLEITWVVEEMSASIVSGSPCIKNVIVIPRDRWKREGRLSSRSRREYIALLKGIRKKKFDVSIDLQGYAKSGILALASGARYRVGWRRLRDIAGVISMALPARPESKHRVDWFLDTVAALGGPTEAAEFPMHIPSEAVSRVHHLAETAGITGKYAVINPSVGSPTRKWSAERYGSLAARLYKALGMRTILVGSKKDKQDCEAVRIAAIAAGMDPQIAPLDLSGLTNIKELAALLKGAAVHICGDTGSAHIAAGLGTPVAALYGPTDPVHAGPWKQAENVLSHREFCKAGCGVRKCVCPSELPDAAGTARCLAEITCDEVLETVLKLVREDAE